MPGELGRLAELAALDPRAGGADLAEGWRAWLRSGEWDSRLIASLMALVRDWRGGAISRAEFERRVTAIWADWLAQIREGDG